MSLFSDERELFKITFLFLAAAAVVVLASADKSGNTYGKPESSSSSPPGLEPKRLSLLSKAIHSIVRSQCGTGIGIEGNVNDLELDTFQAYLNRQIMLKANPQTLKNSLSFNELFQDISKCAALSDDEKIISTEPTVQANFTSTMKSVEPLPLPLPPSPPTVDPTTQKTTTATTTTSSATEKLEAEISSPTTPPKIFLSRSAIQESDKERNQSPPITYPGQVTDHKDVDRIHIPVHHPQSHPKSQTKTKTKKKLEKINHKNTTPATPIPTTIDKIVNNANKFANDFFDKTKKFGRDFMTSFFGKRRKRDVVLATKEAAEVEEEEQEPAFIPFYSRANIGIPSKFAPATEDDSYLDIWKSVTASEFKKIAEEHFMEIFRNFQVITGMHCSQKGIQINGNLFQKVLEFLSLLIDEDLKEIEELGMRLNVNQEFEYDVWTCMNKKFGKEV